VRKLEFLFVTLSFLAITVAASFIYYKRIKQAQVEYERSKDLVRSITQGFVRQVERISKSIAGMQRDASDALHMAGEALDASRDAISTAEESRKETKKLAERIDDTDTAISSMREEIQKLAERPVAAPVQARVEAPIPVEGDAVLENLTETELEVLALIEELGEGAVPEIRERIGKTREHTARLLKKLYERGFIDRNTSGMPYRYHVRKEIRELIQQQKERMRLAV
jgi:uncharacterized membrane protein